MSLVGGYGIVGAGSSIHGSYSNIPNHDAIKVKLKVYYVDSWDTEVAEIIVAGHAFYRTWFLDWSATNFCGSGYRDSAILETI